MSDTDDIVQQAMDLRCVDTLLELVATLKADATRYLGMFFIWLGGVVIGASLHLFGVLACLR